MASEPIAIIGIGCRLPGGVGDAPSAFRSALDGRSAVGAVPPPRWGPQAQTRAGRGQAYGSS